MIFKGFDKVNKIGGNGENGRCLASKMSGEECVKDRGVLRKLGRVMGIVQSKQVVVDLSLELKKIGKLVVKLLKQEKRWLKVLEIRQKAKKIRAYFDAPPNCTDALCATYV